MQEPGITEQSPDIPHDTFNNLDKGGEQCKEYPNEE
jgi:hypothetical protein